MTSIVIPTYNNVQLLEDCLASLKKHVSVEEIIVVDNGSREHSMKVFSNDIIYVRLPSNTGFAHACNVGAEIASSPYILFLNNDTIAHNDFVTPMIKSFQIGTGAVGSKLLFPDGSIQHAGVDFVYDQDGKLHGIEYREERPEGEVPAVTGACMMVRASAFWEARGFDERYWNGNEDVDLCLALKRNNWAIRYQPNSVVTHLVSQSGDERWAKVNENVDLLNLKWNSKTRRASGDLEVNNGT